MRYSKIIFPLVMLFAIIMVSSCSDDTVETEVRDGKYHIGVGMEIENTVEVKTRASEGYDDFKGAAYDGWVMGIIARSTSGTFADDGSATYSGTGSGSSATGSWTSNLWLGPGIYDFYAYIPYPAESRNVSVDASNKTLTFVDQPPFATKDLLVNVGAAYDTDGGTSTITNGQYQGEVKQSGNNKVNFRMNHLLAGLNINFKLGATDNYDYSTLRQIEITKISLGSTVSNSKSYSIVCDYSGSAMAATYNAAGASAADVANCEFAYTGDTKSMSDGTTPVLLLTKTYQAFNGEFFIVPTVLNDSHEITMTITYNVYDRESTSSDWVMTRSGATATNSHLVLYKNGGFATNIQAAHVYTLDVNVVPTYIYQLSDRDQNTIYLQN